jgi:hypothetical protein
MKLKAEFLTWFNRKEYNKNIRFSRLTSIITHLLSSTIDKNIIKTKHPFHDRKLKDFQKIINSWDYSKEYNINFGDSLTDLSREEISSCHDGIFSISGSWSHHIQNMATDLNESLNKFKIRNISIGCLGGNPLLVYQNFDQVCVDALTCLDKVRSLYPQSRIIVYGLPSAYNLHVIEHTYQFDNILKSWVSIDTDAKFIDLKHPFGIGVLNMFPSIKYSSDGVHFNPKGAYKFSELIKKVQK